MQPSIANPYQELGRREREIMDVIFRLGNATAAEVRDGLAEPPSYSSVRGMLRLLEEKGFVRHEWDGPRYVYQPTASPDELRHAAAKHMLRTFFNDSMESAVSAMLGAADRPPTEAELARLAELIEGHRGKGSHQ